MTTNFFPACCYPINQIEEKEEWRPSHPSFFLALSFHFSFPSSNQRLCKHNIHSIFWLKRKKKKTFKFLFPLVSKWNHGSSPKDSESYKLKLQVVEVNNKILDLDDYNSYLWLYTNTFRLSQKVQLKCIYSFINIFLRVSIWFPHTFCLS